MLRLCIALSARSIHVQRVTARNPRCANATAVHPACLVAFSGQAEGRAIALRAKEGICRPTNICSQSFHRCSTVLDTQHLLPLLRPIVPIVLSRGKGNTENCANSASVGSGEHREHVESICRKLGTDWEQDWEHREQLILPPSISPFQPCALPLPVALPAQEAQTAGGAVFV